MTSNRTLVYCLVAMVLVSAGTASAQVTLSTNPTSLTFPVQPGSSAVAQTLTVSATSPVTFTATAATTTGGGWLAVAPGGGQTPATLFVLASPGSLPVGSYNGTITITAQGAANSPLVVQVTLNVGTVSTSQLTASPPSLGFSYVVGGTAPAPQNLLVTSTTVIQVNFTASASTGTGTNWLTLNTAIGTTPASLTVAVNVTGLAPGSYTGTITLTPVSGIGGSLQVPVTLTVTGIPQLSATPSAVTFYHQVGQTPPAQQLVTVASGGTPVAFTAMPGTASGGSWLVVSPNAAVTPSDLTVGVSSAVLALLPPGTYQGTITLSSAQVSNSPLVVPITLLVSNNPFLTASPASLSFTMSPGGSLPATQNLSVNSTGTPIPFVITASTTTSGVNWLTTSPIGAITPATVVVGINAAAQTLPPGSYTGTVTLTPTTLGIPPATVAVTLTVSSVPALTIGPPTMVFNYQTTKVPPAIQSVEIKSTGVPVSFQAQASTTGGGSWLQISATSGTTPATISVSANPAGLAPATYQGSVAFTPAGGGATQTLQVTLNVSNSALMNVSPGTLSFDFVLGSGAPKFKEVALTSTGDPLNFSVTWSTTSGGGNWMAVTPAGGSTPANLTVFANAASLPLGTYDGSITVAATGANTQIIPVRVTVTSGINLAVTPATLNFTQSMGGAAPAAQRLSLATTGTSVRYTAMATTSLAAGWLGVSPSAGSTPAELSVTVDASRLPQPGVYFGSITIVSPEAANSPVNVTVTFTLNPPQTIAVNPSTVQFNYQVGAAAPAAQRVAVSSTGGNLAFTAAAMTASGSGWLAVSPASGSTPGEVSVSVTPAGLAVGTYNGTISVASPDATNSPQAVAVTLIVAAAPQAEPSLASVANAASYAVGPLSVGEILYLRGANLGPPALTTLQLVGGRVSTVLADTRILFDGIPAALIYVSSTESSAIVPYALYGRASTRIQVEYKGLRSNSLEFNMANSAPGIFALNATGQGQGAILNQDYSVNGASNPAPKGSVVMIYATGEGQVSPAVLDGSVTPGVPPFPSPLLPVTVTIGGRPAQVFYAGPAPNFVAGVLQVNAHLAEDTPTGAAVPVVITVGAASSQATITMAVR